MGSPPVQIAGARNAKTRARRVNETLAVLELFCATCRKSQLLETVIPCRRHNLLHLHFGHKLLGVVGLLLVQLLQLNHQLRPGHLLGLCQLEQGYAKEALLSFDAALKLNPDLEEALAGARTARQKLK